MTPLPSTMDDNAPPAVLKNRAPARPWNAEEDTLLRAAVAKHGDNTDHWKLIAEAVPGRTNKACRKRWKHSLSPTLKKTAWTKEEDDLLVKLHAEFPCRWSMIAKQISGRTDDACAKRYREALDPAIKQGEWTPEEDEKLLLEYRRWGGRWASVAAQLGRSGLGCRNRWRLLERKKASHSSRTMAPSSSCCSHGNDEESAEEKEGISPRDEPDHSAQGSEGPPSPQQSTISANEILLQTQYDPFRFDSSFFSNIPLGTGFSPLDPELPGVDYLNGQTTLQFDARLWDIMQGGCGCGCGSKAGCGCKDDMAPPFLDISSQDFFGPFHQMTQAVSRGGDSMSMVPSSPHLSHFAESHNPPFDNTLLTPPSFSIPPAPLSHHSQVTPILPGAQQPSDFVGETHLSHYSEEPNQNIHVSQPLHFPPPSAHDSRAAVPGISSSNSILSSHAVYKLEDNQQQRQFSASFSRTTLSDQRSASVSPSLTSSDSISDSVKWKVATAASLLARFRDSPPCKCPGTCCSRPGASTPSSSSNITPTTGSCCSSTKTKGVKRPSLPIETSSSSSRIGSPPVMKRLKRQSLSATDVSLMPRLSSHLQASSNSNTQLLPYACGDPACWVSDNDIRARFNTSGELLDHHRKAHHDVVSGTVEGRIFRCALEGCGKGWKSINGIQYHLQLSKAHFAVAINKQVLASSEAASKRGRPDPDSFPEGESAMAASTSASSASDQQQLPGNNAAKRKMHLCPHPGCPNIYKQAAGLKYHLVHGHPNNPPLQLGVVPPALAQRMSEKVKKRPS